MRTDRRREIVMRQQWLIGANALHPSGEYVGHMPTWTKLGEIRTEKRQVFFSSFVFLSLTPDYKSDRMAHAWI